VEEREHTHTQKNREKDNQLKIQKITRNKVNEEKKKEVMFGGVIGWGEGLCHVQKKKLLKSTTRIFLEHVKEAIKSKIE
jgi:hypothetical protein